MKTIQEIFTQVRTHLLTQMQQALDNDDTCLYKSPNGLMCAVGCLLNDEAYDPIIEESTPMLVGQPHQHGDNKDLLISKWRFILEASDISSDNNTLIFLSSLQKIHDCCTPREWEERLRAFAEKHGLKNE